MNYDDLFEGIDRSRWNENGLLDDIEALHSVNDSSDQLEDILREFGSSSAIQESVPAADDAAEDTAASEPSPSEEMPPEAEVYQDFGVYRSYDGNREYHSFDESLPEASPDEWYSYEEESDEKYDDEDYDDWEYDDEEYEDTSRRKKRRHPILSGILNTLLAVLTVIAVFYLLVIYSNIPFLNNLRSLYIQTAMSTINHKWLATAIVPSDMIDDVMRLEYENRESMVGVESEWGNFSVEELPSLSEMEKTGTAEQEPAPQKTTAPADTQVDETEDDPMAEIFSSPEAELFFEVFWELDRESVENYIREHPTVLYNGWAGIDINESSLDAKGTDMYTIHGDQVLALNAVDGITLIRVYLSSNRSRGVMAICKDTSRLKLCVASTLGTTGQTAGRICDNNGGILAITGSAFMDDGYANGGQISGLAVCSGVIYGERLSNYEVGAKRLELRSDNKMYIVDSTSELGAGTRDACEFHPALIVDGTVYHDDWWSDMNPRAVLGQTNKLETIMVVVEGRLASSLGCSTGAVADKMAEYGCVQALNLDGGTSAMMYYKGEFINLCSNPALPGGRTLPTAWVYMPSR